MSWLIETWSVFGGWSNSWWLDDELQTFATEADAMTELKEFIEESERLAAQGEIEEPFSWDDYRIRELP